MDKGLEFTPREERDNWRQKHPLLRARSLGEGFVCFHTQKLKQQDVELAIRDRKSIEIDANIWGPETGDFPPNTVVSSHHPWALVFGRDLHIPSRKELISPDEIIAQVQDKEVFVKFDIKSPRAIPWVIENARRIPPHLRMAHAFVSELLYSYKGIQGHQASEYLTLKDVDKLRQELEGIPFQLSCRGVSLEDIQFKTGESYPVVDRLCQAVKGYGEVINFNLLDNKRQPREIAYYVWRKHGLMTEVKLDKGETPALGSPYLGGTDHIELATPIS